MNTTLEQPRLRSSPSSAQRLRASMAAARLSIRWLGVRKTLSAEQKARAADTFGAEGEFLSAGKTESTASTGRCSSFARSSTTPSPAFSSIAPN